MSRLPTFIVMGAMKGGTTSLHRYLAGHPDVSVSKRKETDFFLGRRDYRRGLPWYSSQFDGRAAAAGEASPNYTKRHLFAGVPGRISRTLPEVRLVYVVRDPIARIRSHYIHNYAHGRERQPFSEAVTANSNYVKTSLYAYQLDAFLDHFPRENVLVVDSDALLGQTSSALREVLEFIGVTPEYEAPNLGKRFHVSTDKRRPSALARHVGHGGLRRALRPLLPARLTEPQPFEPPELSTEGTRRLADALQPDTERLRKLTGMPFGSWPV